MSCAIAFAVSVVLGSPEKTMHQVEAPLQTQPQEKPEEETQVYPEA